MKLHLWTTPNGYKPLIMLEEIGADFELIKVPLDGTQKKPDYVKLNPNGRIPTLVMEIWLCLSRELFCFIWQKKRANFCRQNRRLVIM